MGSHNKRHINIKKSPVIGINYYIPACHMDLNAVFSWEWLSVFGEWLACSHILPCSSLRQAEPKAGLVHPSVLHHIH